MSVYQTSHPGASRLSIRGNSFLLSGAFLALAAMPAPASADMVVTGPIPVDSEKGHPFDASDRHKVPAPLAPLRYREEEFFVSSEANVYRHDRDFQTISVTGRGPYVTRLLIRRPENPKRFSGNVVVELYNAAAKFDQGFIWADAHEHMMANGDIWIGVTARPSAVAALKKFNPVRYAPLSWKSPVSTDSTCASLPEDSSGATENGFVYDILTQVGELVRLKRAPNPLAIYDVRFVFAAGYSQTASVLFTYIGAIAPQPGSTAKPIFDGYLLSASGGGRYPLSQCADPLPAGHPRWTLHGGPSAIVQLQTQSDFMWTLASRRPDGDAPDDRFRLYEIAGASHVNASQTPFLPGEGELAGVGLPPVDHLVAGCDLKGPFNPLPTKWTVQVALSGLEQWVRRGTPPPSGSTIATDAGKTAPLLDRFGNAKDGVRNPYLDIPQARYLAASDGAAARCRLYGYTMPFDARTLRALYGTSTLYKARMKRSTALLEAEGRLLPRDARAIRGAIRAERLDW